MTVRTVAWHCPIVRAGVDFGDASAQALAIANIVAPGFNAAGNRCACDRPVLFIPALSA